MPDTVHIVTLVSATALCGVPAGPGLRPRPLILDAPLITHHPVCPACEAERARLRAERCP